MPCLTPLPTENRLYSAATSFYYHQSCRRSTNQDSVRTADLRCLWSRHLERSSPSYPHHRLLPCFPAFAKNTPISYCFLKLVLNRVFIIHYVMHGRPIFFRITGHYNTHLCYVMLPTSAWVRCSAPSVCLFVCLSFISLIVRSITQKRMIPKCSNLV